MSSGALRGSFRNDSECCGRAMAPTAGAYVRCLSQNGKHERVTLLNNLSSKDV